MFEIIMDCWLIFWGSYISSMITYKLVKLSFMDKNGWFRNDSLGVIMDLVIQNVFGLFAIVICMFAGAVFLLSVFDASKEISNNNIYLQILFLCGASFSIGFLYYLITIFTNWKEY